MVAIGRRGKSRRPSTSFSHEPDEKSAGVSDQAPTFPWSAFLVASAVALLLIVGTFVRNPITSSVTSDDGAYALHAESLADGRGWSIPHALAEVDPDGETYPFVNSEITDEGFFPGGRHAVWAWFLSIPTRLLGTYGMHALVAATMLLAVAAAGALAGVAGKRTSAAIAIGLTAASPLLFNSLQLWAHTPAAAFVAVAMVGALRVMDGDVRPVPVAALLAGCALAASVRGDGAVFALATSAVVVLSAVRARSVIRSALGALAGASTVAAYIAAARYAESITGSASSVPAEQSRATGSSSGRWAAFLQTFFSEDLETGSFLLICGAVGLVLLGVILMRKNRPERAAALIGGAATVWFVHVLAYGDTLATGLVGAWPLALLALAVPRDRRTAGERRLVAMVFIGGLGVALTQYDIGGGTNWGGRFLAPAIPALAVLAAGAIPPLETLRQVRQSALHASLAVLAGVLLLASWSADDHIRSNHVSVLSKLDSVDPTLPVLTSALHYPRLDWASYPERQWLLIPDGEDGAEVVRELLEVAGVDRAVVYITWPETARAIAGRTVRGGDELPAGLILEPEVVEIHNASSE